MGAKQRGRMMCGWQQLDPSPRLLRALPMELGPPWCQAMSHQA